MRRVFAWSVSMVIVLLSVGCAEQSEPPESGRLVVTQRSAMVAEEGELVRVLVLSEGGDPAAEQAVALQALPPDETQELIAVPLPPGAYRLLLWRRLCGESGCPAPGTAPSPEWQDDDEPLCAHDIRLRDGTLRVEVLFGAGSAPACRIGVAGGSQS